jgi:hypothetical protein
MNDTVLKLYNDYLKLTGNELAASNLALADTMQTAKDEPDTHLRDSRHTVAEVAKLYRVSHVTVRTWNKTGKLTAIVVSPAGSKCVCFRISEEALRAFDVEHRLSVASQVTKQRRPKREKLLVERY